jgi:RNA polymerase II subunit A small phosphatase-like protein
MNPQGIITQVPRDNGSQEQDTNNSQNTTVEVETSDETPKRGFLRSLCSCFFIKQTGEGRKDVEDDNATEIGIVTDNTPLLPPPAPDLAGRKCLVLDLDETLVHSSFKPIPNPDFIIPVEIEEQVHKVYVLKRPGVDQFLQRCGPLFEVVVFTASLAKYADPVLDLLDSTKVVHHRLFREACTNYKGNFVKDMSRLGRDLKHCLIIDNSPTSYLFHPENAIPCETWYDDEHDTELLDLLPVLEQLTKVDNVCTYLQSIKKKDGRIL